MKQLNEYDTPEVNCLVLTDAHKSEDYVPESVYHRMIQQSRDLEQRLAACRDALAMINNGVMTAERIEIICTETLTLTAPKQ
jgi:hypothetical protein